MNDDEILLDRDEDRELLRRVKAYWVEEAKTQRARADRLEQALCEIGSGRLNYSDCVDRANAEVKK